MPDHQAMSRVLRLFAHTMAGNHDVTSALDDLSDSVVEVFCATAASVALLDGDQLRFVTATSEEGSEAERAQERLQNGPCVDAIEQGRPVAVADMRDQHGRWPDYAPTVEQIGFRAVLSLPLVLDDRRVGAIDVYNAEPRAWTEEQVDAALVLADVCAAYVINATELAESHRSADQLQTALDSRVVIEQAKGILAERAGITPNQAFDQIRSAARRESTKLRAICSRVIESDYLPE